MVTSKYSRWGRPARVPYVCRKKKWMTPPAAPPVPVTIDLQPGPATRCEFHVNEASPNSAYPTALAFNLTNWATARFHGGILFDLAVIPPAATLVAATFYLYGSASGLSGNRPLTIRRILSANLGWTNVAPTWNYHTPTTQRWAGDVAGDGGTDAGCTILGTDLSSTIMATMTFNRDPLGNECSAPLDLAELALMIAANAGFRITHDLANLVAIQPLNGFYPTTPAYRPKLSITYLPP